MRQEQTYPILEFDPTPEAILEPKQPCFCTGKTLLARCRSLLVVVTGACEMLEHGAVFRPLRHTTIDLGMYVLRQDQDQAVLASLAAWRRAL